MLVCMVFFISHWYLSLFCQSFFLHRYASHKMFELSPFWQKFFYIMTFVTQGTSFLNPAAYATLHNLHHEHSDRPEDPHSPHQNDNLLTMMWSTFMTYESLVKDKVKIPARFRFKEFEKMDTITDLWSIRLCWIFVYATFYYLFAPHPIYYLLIKEFKDLTGCPVLVNTSFNVRGEPIVCSPEDAFRCFMGTDLDALIIENFYLDKSNQDINLYEDYKYKYELD